MSAEKVSVKFSHALATIGGECIEFCLRPEIFPLYVAWLREDSGHPDWPADGIRSDLSRILRRIPRKADQS